MQKLIQLTLFLMPFLIMAQSKNNFNKIEKIQDGIYFMYYDSSSIKHQITKSTIIEFKDFIAMIDMPIVQQGGGAKQLTDHTAEGEQVIAALKNYFPAKPLKYIFSSHWHPHSISSILPFISNKITLVTTSANFEKIKEMVDSSTYTKYKKYIYFVENDSFVIQDKMNKIVAYKITKEDYPSVPTNDYLYFYFPKYNYFNSACMFWQTNTFVADRELIHSRLFDLNKFLNQKNMQPSYFTRYIEDAKTNGVIPYKTLNDILKNGLSNDELQRNYFPIKPNMTDAEINLIVENLLTNKIQNTFVNEKVYDYLYTKELEKAVSLAKIQTLINPSDANVWDTYGETLYFLGKTELAKHYEKQSQLINPEFKDGGEKVWKKDLASYQKTWSTNKN